MKKGLLCLLLLMALLLASGAWAEEQVASIHITSKDMLSLTAKEQEAKGYFEYRGLEGEEVKGYITAEVMGTLSLSYPKKNYNIRFYSDAACTKSINVQFREEWGSHSKYCMKANWVDVTHARNIVLSRLYAQAQAQYGLFTDSPNNGQIDGFFVEVYVNGNYHGLYTLNIPKSSWLFGLDKKNDNHVAMMARSTDPQSAAAFAREAAAENKVEWEIEVGPDKTQKDVEHCFAMLNELIRFVKNSTDEEFVQHFSEHLNLDACLNYYSYLYLTNAVDNKTKNMILVTFDGDVWYPTMYDLDATWGLYFGGDGLYAVNDRFPENHITSVLWDRFAKLFAPQILERYTTLRQTVWSQENIAAEFTAFMTSIPQATYERDRNAWPDLQLLQGDLEQIISYAQLRGNYTDSCIAQLAVTSPVPQGNILFQLEVPYAGMEYGFANTGINLYPAEAVSGQDYTIILQYSNHSAAVEGKVETLLSNIDPNGHGLILQTAGANYTMFYAGPHKYEALYHFYPTVRSLIIVKQQGTYTFYADDVNNVRVIQEAELDRERPANLYIGAYAFAATDGGMNFSQNFTGTLHRLEVLNRAVTAEEADALMQEILEASDRQ